MKLLRYKPIRLRGDGPTASEALLRDRDRFPIEDESMNEQTDVFIPKDRLLLVAINRMVKNGRSIYDATRHSWPVNRQRAEKVDFVLGCANGVVKGVFIADEWLDASPGEPTKRNFPTLNANNKGPRLGFVGRPADQLAQDCYLGKRVPNHLKFGQRAFRYSDDV